MPKSCVESQAPQTREPDLRLNISSSNLNAFKDWEAHSRGPIFTLKRLTEDNHPPIRSRISTESEPKNFRMTIITANE